MDKFTAMRNADDAVRAMLQQRAEASRNGASEAVLADFDYRLANLNATHASCVGAFAQSEAARGLQVNATGRSYSIREVYRNNAPSLWGVYAGSRPAWGQSPLAFFDRELDAQLCASALRADSILAQSAQVSK